MYSCIASPFMISPLKRRARSIASLEVRLVFLLRGKIVSVVGVPEIFLSL